MEDSEALNLAEKMSRENYERFRSLVKMHLSFELENLNWGEFDLPCHEVMYVEKGKVKKWNRLTKKMKGCTSNKNSPELSSFALTKDFIEQLRILKKFLLKEDNVIQEGIFRRAGAVSRQNELRSLLNQRRVVDVDEGYTVHDCATVFKGFLADLPEPLLTDAHYPAHCQIAGLCNSGESSSTKNRDEHVLHSVQLLLLLLPDENRVLLEDIVDMLHTTSKYESQNKMSPDSLATLFAPHLICPRNLPPEALHYVSQTMSSVLAYMIFRGTIIFDTPPRLITDIRAYFHEQKRKKTMSPEQILDESISDISTVNTVYTFVDREKTAEAHNSNPTDTALAQLYAHIQSLPESSKKRKLIKQFNKENGQGTPLQLLMMNRVKNASAGRSAKSIGDSIKKHIFNKSIISRTPKRSHPIPASFDTPNSGPTNPKLRVLFQSPMIPSPASSIGSTSKSISDDYQPSIRKNLAQKSISSSSLLTNSPQVKSSVSSPLVAVSRASSGELCEIDAIETSDTLETPCKPTIENLATSTEVLTTPISMNCSATTTNPATGKKTVAFMGETKITLEPDSNDEFLDENASLMPQNGDLSSRYKSEPNLSRVLNDKNTLDTPTTGRGSSFKKKLIKGVSMGNLRFSFTPDNKKVVKKSTSMLLLSRNSALRSKIDVNSPNKENFEGIERTPRSVNQLICTSTPSFLFGQKSVSPITKSTQRMPKSMQESIMTPRSRKPVMLTATLASMESNSTVCNNEFSSFREEDEDSIMSNQEMSTSHLDKGSPRLHRSRSESDFRGILEDHPLGTNSISSSAPESLTNTFREYLLTRSVLTTSPVDSSFSSHSDDFESSPDFDVLGDSELSASLLYCLDGNQPNVDLDFSDQQQPSNNRKRRSTETESSEIDTKRSFIFPQNKQQPGETSL